MILTDKQKRMWIKRHWQAAGEKIDDPEKIFLLAEKIFEK